MIYVVEFPEQGKARAWFAFDYQDFARKVYASDTRPEWEIFDVASPRELLDMLDTTPEADGARDKFPSICSLADLHGWDTPLYRADYLLGAGVFQAQAVSESAACAAALAQRLKACSIYWSDTQATAALDNDPVFNSREGFWGHEALRGQLIALEILEGPNG
jgi:hypothetical protein